MRKTTPRKKKNITTRQEKIVKKKPEKKVPAKRKTAKKSIQQKKKEGIKPFPVVGIGASAGGLQAFSELLHHLSPTLGMAYVYVQHLSSEHPSFLPEILKRKTKMKVHKVTDNMPIEKDNVYVIPADKHLTIADGKLKLIPKEDKGFHSIDLFLTELAYA